MTGSAQLGDDDLYLRFEPTGQVFLGRRRRRPDYWCQEFPLSSDEMDRLGSLVDEWRTLNVTHPR